MIAARNPFRRIAARAGPALGLALLVGLGIGVRRAVLAAQQDPGVSLPFTLESALHYRRIREIFMGNGLPAVDRKLQAPEGARTFETDTVGSEYMVAWAARRMPDTMTLPERVRWIHVSWFCFGIAWMALWIRWKTGSWAGAWAGGLLYAVSLSAVMRSTGQELSHENIALPFLLAHLALDARAGTGTGSRWRRAAARAGSAVSLGLALATWDLIQFYVALRAISYFLAGAREGPARGSAQAAWALEITALLAVGVFHPYFRAHRFVVSPALGLYGAAGLFLGIRRADPGFLRRIPGIIPALAAVVLGLVPAGLGGYAGRYGHFGRLLAAKLRFLNMKPADPALLDFDQRIMWTPALHSASPAMTLRLFPAILFLALAAHALVRFRQRADPGEGAPGSDPGVDPWIAGCGMVSFLAYVLFVRFQVFAALFLCAGIGFCAASLFRRPGGLRWGFGLLCAAGIFIEGTNTVRGAARWGRFDRSTPERKLAADLDIQALRGTAAWLREHAPGETVLANFGLSAFLLAYADAPIVLHPKFESPLIRERVREYGTLLFHGPDESFADWALDHGAGLFIYARGEFSPLRPEYQMRYMVDALEPPVWSPARRFEWMPDRVDRFLLVQENWRYRIFRILPRETEPGAVLPESGP